MDVFVILSILAVIGIGETLYLIRTRHNAEQPICLIGHNCAKVLTSKYNRLFGIHNDVLGLTFYITTLVLSVALVMNAGDEDLLLNMLRILVAGAVTMSSILIFIQWKILKAWCTWCLSSACNNALMAVTLLYQTRQ
jgi:uncharacterized membrane protein